jgi:hypothetical protein
MKNYKGLFNGLAAAISLFFLVSCNEGDRFTAISEQEERELARLVSTQDEILDAEQFAIDDIIYDDGGGRLAAGCANVTRHESGNAITVDFGSGCTGPFGRERSGKVIITYGGEFGDHLANRLITFDNYVVNGKQITGTIELRDFTMDESGNPTFTRRHTGLRITWPDGSYFSSEGSVTVTWISGFGDRDLTNNVMEISGSHEGLSSRGRRVTRIITEPLVINFGCWADENFPVVSGRMEVSIEGLRKDRSRTLEFGNGQCDDVVEVTVAGKKYSVTIG